MNFREFLESSNPGSKTGLYPMGYGGIGLYPPSWYITRSADAIYYFTLDERIYKSQDGGEFNIKHIPGEEKKQNSGEGGAWNIKGIE
jgi:hypothetical protein